MSEPNPPTGTPGPPPATAPLTEPDWTDQVTDLVVDTVDKVRDRTTGPVLKASRIAVYGLVAVIVAIPLVTVGIILIGRLLELFPGPIWIPYTVLGLILVLVGLIVWGKRRPNRV